jgi:hypothetical protein
MADSSFDAARAVRFDLPSGSVHAAGDARVALVPIEALAAIGKSGAADDVARIIGAAIGKRAASHAGGGASVEAFTNALGGELAVAGYGSLAVERWGRALVVVVTKSAVPESMLATLVASAIGAASRRTVACATLGTDGEETRLLVTNDSAAAKVRAWLGDGVKWGDAIARLHGGAA